VSQKTSQLWLAITLTIDIHEPISIIFGKNVSEEAKKSNDVSLSNLLHYLAKQETRKLRLLT